MIGDKTIGAVIVDVTDVVGRAGIFLSAHTARSIKQKDHITGG